MKMDTLESGRRNASRRGGSKIQAKPIARSKQNRTRVTATSRSRAKASSRSKQAGGRRGGSAKVTTNLNEIRQWAEARGGKPVSVKGTARRGGAGLLRIDFPGYSGAGRFEEISWDEWYEKFRESNLEFLYQDQAANGQKSRFFKLVCRGTAKGGSSRAKSPSRSRARAGTQSRGGSRRSAGRGKR